MKILNIKCDVIDSFLGLLVNQLEVEGLDRKFLYLVESDGFPCFYFSNEDFYEEILKNDSDDDEFTTLLDNSIISEYKGINLEDYDTINDSIDSVKDVDARKLIKLIVAIMRSNWDATNTIIKESNGKDINDIKEYDIDFD